MVMSFLSVLDILIFVCRQVFHMEESDEKYFEDCLFFSNIMLLFI